jgi:hypothetical protein
MSLHTEVEPKMGRSSSIRHNWWPRGTTKMYDIDYDETFAQVMKMSKMRTLVLLAVNGGVETIITRCEECVSS